MRVLMSPVGSRGDVQPLLALGRAMRARGHWVAINTSRDCKEWVDREGFPFLPIDLDARELVRLVGTDLLNPRLFVRLAGLHAWRVFEGVRAAVHDVDIVVGAGLQGIAPTYCEERSIPYVFAAYCPLALRSRFLPPYSVPYYMLPTWFNRLAWWAQDVGVDLVMRRRINAVRAKLGLAPIGRFFDHLTRSGPVLAAFDPIVAPPAPDWSGEIAMTGFWYYDDPTPIDPALARFIEAGSPPIYVGFGSMPSSDPAATTRLILEAIRSAGVRAVISAGWSGLGGVVLPATAYRAGPLSHAALLPRMAAAIHHGGAGTTAAAARAGIPQLVVPHLLDQYYWGHRVHVLGLGPARIPICRLTSQVLARSIQELFRSDVRERARRTGERLRATDGVGLAVEALERIGRTLPRRATVLTGEVSGVDRGCGGVRPGPLGAPPVPPGLPPHMDGSDRGRP